MIARLTRIATRLVAPLLALGMIATPAAAQPVTVTDLAGRTVTLPGPAKRIVLAQGRQLNGLGLLHPDPISLLAGWGSDHKRQNPDAYARYAAKFPALETLPTVGDGGTQDGFSFEKAVSLAPDLVILSQSLAGSRHGPGDLVSRFEAAGITVAVVDFYLQPLRDTVRSLRVLGKLIGREEQAEAYIRFYEERRERLASRVRGVERPSVFMHAHAGGFDCCQSPGKGTFDDFITLAGGRNIAASILPGATGQISLEQLLAADPAVYVATGGVHLARRGGLVLGLGVSPEEGARSFATLIAGPGISALSAVRSGRAYGLWQLFNDTPLHIVAIEALAKWIHPERFADLDPQATLNEIQARFSAIPLDGTLWIDGTAKSRP
ncbi:MAG TPA: ABC transporter substrate-binding protein [Bosea sp. (in: a-proteobacteria)]|jgi:iron complex transport system substrate-binding protein|uniref:ABC transporter substrate-binding protein n=1 Tax=Bosea sp. (in: a-proteobacteria) TaxID=1871050 RepID=UPI002E109BC6|nr:ABC transporter substrate-binding protein [Bosea sp. (in: a-proteobacteria)]